MLRTILSATILFAVIWFAVSNAAAVTLNIFFWHVSVSAALVIFLTFLIGFVFGVLRVAPSWFHKRSQVGQHRDALMVCQREQKEQSERIVQLETELASLRSESETQD